MRRKTSTCFLTSGYFLTDNYFRCTDSCVRISHVDSEWSSGSKPSSQVSAGISVPGRNSTSGTVFTSQPSRARDLVTMVEGGRTPGWVETDVGSVSRGAGMEPNSPDRWVRPTLRFVSESIFITGNFVKRLLTYLGKFGQTAEATVECDFPRLR